MVNLNGGFSSSLAADSEGHKGKFFVWTPDEIRSVLGGSAAGLLIVSKTRSDTNEAQLFIDALRVLKRTDYKSVATHNAEFLLTNIHEGQARLNGYLEDYANWGEGLRRQRMCVRNREN